MEENYIHLLSKATKSRLRRFNSMRGKPCAGEFWDIVVLTAVDDVQRKSYEIQLNRKVEQKELPRCEYLVVADPVGPKIGNGGSTLVVIDHLYVKYGEEIWNKKVILIHAGGFSQRLPNASAMGKAFTAVPIGEPIYQALELKLASYIDFPSKIIGGGIFLCCADTVEVYCDNGLPWSFPSQGFTALAHMSHVSIGTTHGVFVLDSPLNSDAGASVVWKYKRFLHKPSVEEMVSHGCVVREDDSGLHVMTDSAFFISVPAAKLLLDFFSNVKPLRCEIDAYGDFLQGLGKDSTLAYIHNTRNVCHQTTTLVETREKVYNLIKDSPAYAVALAPCPVLDRRSDSAADGVFSTFFHLGTIPECHHHFTADPVFRSVLGSHSLTWCSGMPYRITGHEQHMKHSRVMVKKNGAITCSVLQTELKTPCIMSSVIRSDVSVGQGTIVEYCYLHDSVAVGESCIISNCCVPAKCNVPRKTFLHTVGVNVNDEGKYATIMFGIDDNLKKAYAAEDIRYFGKTLLASLIPRRRFLVENETDLLSLWEAKLFPLSATAQESCEKACAALRQITSHESDECINLYPKEELYSIKELLNCKNVDKMLEFRLELGSSIHSAAQASGSLSFNDRLSVFSVP